MHHQAEQPARLSITRTDADGIRVLALDGEIDADNADALRNALQIEEDGTPRTVIDFSEITFMDSSSLSVLAAAHLDADTAGGWLRLAALTRPVQRVVDVIGLNTVVACYPTLAEALKP